MSDLIQRFGAAVDAAIPAHPAAARALLLTGYRAQGLRLRLAPEKGLTPAQRYIAQISMDAIIRPLAHPGRAALVNVFMPCELLQVFGIAPMFAEATSCYLCGADAEKGFLQYAEGAGIPATLCSYHRALLGAGLSEVMPRPMFTACTSLACDANNLTFRKLAQHYNVPMFYIDVPYERSEDAVAEVAARLREFAAFLEDTTHRRLDEAALHDAVARSGRTLKTLAEAQAAKAGRCLAGDVTSELYEVFVAHTMLGTPQAERYAELRLKDILASPKGGGKRIFWVHTIPFYQAPVRELLNRRPDVQLIGCDMGTDALDVPIDPDRPFESMARRLVYNSLNGPAQNRIDRVLALCREQGIDGVVYFCHWGCKQTLGAAQLFRTALEAAGYPVLLLDGDGCDRANTSDGQTATRLGAFLEMLEAKPGKEEAQ